MSWPFDHHLHARIPCALRKFTNFDKFSDLARIGCVVGRARPHGVADTDGYVVFVQNCEHVVVVFVKRILVAGCLHPGKQERAPARHNVGQAPCFSKGFNGTAVHACVNGKKVHAILRVCPNHAQKIFHGDIHQRFFQIANGVIHGHGANHGGRFLNKLRAECVRFARV